MLNWNMSTATNTLTVLFTPPPQETSKEKKRIISLDEKHYKIAHTQKRTQTLNPKRQCAQNSIKKCTQPANHLNPKTLKPKCKCTQKLYKKGAHHLQTT